MAFGSKISRLGFVEAGKESVGPVHCFRRPKEVGVFSQNHRTCCKPRFFAQNNYVIEPGTFLSLTIRLLHLVSMSEPLL